MVNLSDVRRIAVIGSGIMRSGITQAALLGGYEVVLTDIDATALKKSREKIEVVIKAIENEARFKAYVSNHPFLGHFSSLDFSKLKANSKKVGRIADGEMMRGGSFKNHP